MPVFIARNRDTPESPSPPGTTAEFLVGANCHAMHGIS
jgi:hypothetical protein